MDTDTQTPTLPALADAMTAAEIHTECVRLAKMIGGKAHVGTMTDNDDRPDQAATVSVYPTGVCGREKQFIRAPTWPEAFAAAETWIVNNAVVHRDTMIRRMALAIIDLVDQHTRCTVADLTRRDFTADEVREFHEAACARAGEMAGSAPFSVEGV